MIGSIEQGGEEPRYASDKGGKKRKKKKETKTRSCSGAAGTARPLDLLIGWSGTMRLIGDSSPTFSTDWLQKLNWLMVRFVSSGSSSNSSLFGGLRAGRTTRDWLQGCGDVRGYADQRKENSLSSTLYGRVFVLRSFGPCFAVASR